MELLAYDPILIPEVESSSGLFMNLRLLRVVVPVCLALLLAALIFYCVKVRKLKRRILYEEQVASTSFARELQTFPSSSGR